MKTMIILGCLILSFTVIAWGQEKCEAPVWNVGDRWTYGDKSGKQWTQEVTGIESDIYVVRYGNEMRGFDKYSLNYVFDMDRDNRKARFSGTRSKVLDFPLYIGKKWKNVSTGTPRSSSRPRSYSEAYFVSSEEDVTVSAGTFKAFKIEYSHTDMHKGREAARTTYWYSPQVKGIIKRSEFASNSTENMELISYKLTR